MAQALRAASRGRSNIGMHPTRFSADAIENLNGFVVVSGRVMPGVRSLSLMYDDNYPTCEATYATLRIYRDELDPDEISRRLNVAPSKSQKKGEEFRPGHPAPIGGWFLSSKGRVESKDVRRHVAWVLEQFASAEDELRRLQDEEYRTDVSCYWLSAEGHGGPTLDHEIMRRLASLRLDIWFDVYCDERVSRDLTMG